jgi:hypothetical protein
MRKADYTLLASIIREQLAKNEGVPHMQQAVAFIAIKFSQSASVDRAAFLKACGIE